MLLLEDWKRPETNHTALTPESDRLDVGFVVFSQDMPGAAHFQIFHR